ncbi:MAG: hypothetical protein QW767_05160 [Thermoprotei archaeon]
MEKEQTVNKKLLDLRGRQTNIGRLVGFHREAFVHMLFYRILAPFSIPYGIILIATLFYPGLSTITKAMTIVEWILFTPQLFESVKAFSIISTNGLSSGHLNGSFKFLALKRFGRPSPLYSALPYAALALWVAGFIAMVGWWHP